LLVIGVLLLFCLGVLNEGTGFGFPGWSLSLMGVGFFGVLFWTVSSIFWVWVLIDCLEKDFKDGNEKIVWVLVVILLHVLGALLYYLVVKVGHYYKPAVKRRKPAKKKRKKR